MSDLNSIYNNIQNPIKDEKIVNQLIEIYQNCPRTDLIGGGIYNSLVKLNQKDDKSNINLGDREKFYVTAYNEWIENISNLNEEQLKGLEEGGMPDIRKLQNYLISVGRVNSMQDIENLKQNDLFNNEINGWELEDGWTHIKSQYLSGRQEQRINVRHRLYVGCENQDIWKISNEFKKKCEKKGIPYYFKSGQSSSRDDKIVIYSDTQNLANYIDILRDIAKENPEIMQRMGQPPVLTGKIDNWIGIGDEPPKKDSGKNQSYNELRAHLIENSIEETLLKDIIEHKNQTVEYNGKQTKFNHIFIDVATDYVIQTIEKESKRNRDISKFNSYGIRENEIHSYAIRDHIQSNLQKMIALGLKKLDEVKDKKDMLMRANNDAIFTIPTRNGNGVGVNTCDMDYIIKNMVPVMQEIDPKFNEKVSNTIINNADKIGIDPKTFCFSKETKQVFLQTNPVEQETQEPINNISNPKEKFIEGFINAYDTTETEYQYNGRSQWEQSNVNRVQKIINENGMNSITITDLEGKWIGLPEDANFKIEYSQKQVSAMVQLLKAAELLTHNKNLNPEGIDYLKKFSNVPIIDQKLQEMRKDLKDESTYMYRLKQESKENIASGNIPKYPETNMERSIKKDSKKEQLNLLKELKEDYENQKLSQGLEESENSYK